MEARNSRSLRSPPPPLPQKGPTKTVVVDDLLASASTQPIKKRKLFHRLCRSKKKRGLLRRIAIVTLVLIILCGLALAISWAAMDQVCDTPACIIAAARAVSFLDQTVNPCDDFYEFACRGLRENSSSLRASAFNPLSNTLDADYDRILTGQVQPKGMDSRLFPLYEEIKRIHKGCMEGTLNDRYVPFESFVSAGDTRVVVEEAHKFAAIFWDPWELGSGMLIPAPGDNFKSLPWESIYNAYVANASNAVTAATFSGDQLNIILPHLANWTSVIEENLQPNHPLLVINLPFFQAIDNYVGTNPPGLYQNISQIVGISMDIFANDTKSYALGDEQSILENCRLLIRQTHGLGIFYIWLAHRYKSSQVEAAQRITMNLRQTFERRIMDNELLDEVSKNSVREKLLKMNLNIGDGPTTDYVDNLLRLYRISKIQPDIYRVRQLRLSKEALWLANEGVTTVNAVYMSPNNSVIIPYTALREPFFTMENPISMQYGSVGVLIGHEITHAFDRMERLSAIGLSPESMDKMSSSAACFADTYSRYSEANTTVNGTRTLSENIADNGGLNTAWQAYQAEKASGGPFQKRIRLPSLSYTDEQLFFISFAQTWCSASSEQSIRNSMVTSVHSQDKTRVNAGLSLFEPFAKTFNCPASSNMNPIKRCRMWKRGVPAS